MRNREEFADDNKENTTEQSDERTEGVIPIPTEQTKPKRGRPRKADAAQNTPQTVDEAVQIVQKKRRTRSDLEVHVEPGDNAKYLTHSLHMWSWKRPDMTSVEAVEEHIMKYFQLCADDDMKPSVEGLAVAFRTDRKQIWRWANGVDCGNVPQEVCRTVKRAYAILNLQMADYMQNGKINPVAGIFMMKNNMGYEDKTEMVVTPTSPLGAEPNADELQKRISDTVIVDIQDPDN